jgi:hypothetical protein
MEKELIDFWEWLKTASFPEDEYYAVYDDEGNVTAIMSNYHDTTGLRKVVIDSEIAIAIHEGREYIHKFKVDTVTKEFKKIESLNFHGLKKIDDILHRIIDKCWSDISCADLIVTHDKSNKCLIFNLDDSLKNSSWEGETIMTFFITGYNDPNILKEVISFPIGDLSQGPKIFDFHSNEKFSIYTRRILKNYVCEEI